MQLIIKSPKSRNYYTNFQVTADGVVEYDLIDARRTGKNVSRHYIFRDSSDLIVSIHINKMERTILKRNLNAQILMECLRLIAEYREALEVKVYDNRKPISYSTKWSFEVLDMTNAFLTLFFWMIAFVFFLGEANMEGLFVFLLSFIPLLNMKIQNKIKKEL